MSCTKVKMTKLKVMGYYLNTQQIFIWCQQFYVNLIVPLDSFRYELYQPLHNLWRDYMKDLVNFERYCRSYSRKKITVLNLLYSKEVKNKIQHKIPEYRSLFLGYQKQL